MNQPQESAANLPLYLLTIRGTLASSNLDAARDLHNQTAGAPANVAAAQGLGDLSHMVYVPAMPGEASVGAGEFLILDLWNKLDGLNQFFANPQVQEQAGLIFSNRDPVVWAPASGFYSYNLPAPHGKSAQVVAMVRGMVHSHEAAQAAHNAIVGSLVNTTRLAGALSHQPFFRLAPPDSPAALEFCSLDVWSDPVGMAQVYGNPEFGRALQTLFAGEPDLSTWVHPAGDWVEW